MKKSLVAIALASTFAVPAFAADAAPAEHTVTGNMTIASSYRFRGIDQTFGKPALQGGIDYSHSSGLYAGNWNSNVSSGAGYPNGNLEMDFYGGYKTTFGDFGVDVGALYYYYPGSDKRGVTNGGSTKTNGSGTVTNTEAYVGASWKFLSFKYSHVIGDYFSAPETNGTHYLDLSANYDLGDGWGVNAHVGRLNFKKSRLANSHGSYTDYKVGVTKDINGWVLGASYVGTDAMGNCQKGEFYCFSNSVGVDSNSATTTGSATANAGKPTLVLSVTKNF